MQEIARLGKSYDVRFHPDGGRLVAIRGSTELVLAQVPGAEVVSSFRFRDGAAVAVARDGSRIAVVNTSGGGVILDGESFEERVRTSGRGIGEGPGVVFGPDATRYVQASWNGDMLVRESASGEVVYRERHQGEAIHALASTRDGTLFGYAASRNGDEDHAVLLRRWPFETNRPETLVEFNGPGRGADAIALGENGMVALLVDRSVRTYSGDGGDCLVERPWAFPGTDYSLAWSPDGTELTLIENGADNVAYVAALNADDLVDSASAPVPYACALDYSPDGSLLAVGSWESGRVMRR